MKKLIIASLGMMLAMNMNAAKKPKTNALQFNPESGVKAPAGAPWLRAMFSSFPVAVAVVLP